MMLYYSVVCNITLCFSAGFLHILARLMMVLNGKQYVFVKRTISGFPVAC